MTAKALREQHNRGLHAGCPLRTCGACRDQVWIVALYCKERHGTCWAEVEAYYRPKRAALDA